MAYITCKDLIIGFDGKKILSNVCFEVSKGDYLCVVGENGAGKSTLIKTLLHLQDSAGGEIFVGDGLKPYEIGYLPQQSAVQRDFPATVWEVVLSGTLSQCGKRPFYSRGEKAIAEKRLIELGIWELRKKSYRHLSGGQQQRTLLARALCATTKIIFLDEPVNGIDPKATAEFYKLLKKLNQEGMTVIMVSHDLQAVSYATHILHLNRGSSYFDEKETYLKREIGRNFMKTEGKGNVGDN